jgi:hypothetical protein
LHAFRADGSPLWSQALGRSIVASPVVGADGSIYVVTTREEVVADLRFKPPKDRTVYSVVVTKFSSAGDFRWHRPLADHRYDIMTSFGPRTTAPPNIVTNNGVETVILPAIYGTPSGQELRLAAISSGGQLIFDQKVSFIAHEVIGGVDPDLPLWATFNCKPEYSCWYPVDVDPGKIPVPTYPVDRVPMRPIVPLPNVAVFTFAGGGLPWVLVSDHFFDLVGYTFNSNSGFNEIFRRKIGDNDLLTSPPTALPDGHTLVGTLQGKVIVAGPNMNRIPEADLVGAVYGSPTRTADGGVVVTGLGTRVGFVTLLKNGQVVANKEVIGQTIAAAAASRTHIFVSTASSLFTFDAATLQQVNEVSLPGGGLSPPAIGPAGHVYTVASNILFVYPPPGGGKPSRVLGDGKLPVAVLQPAGQTVAPQPEPQPTSQSFEPPLTKSGKRLYACQDFKGNGCGAPVAAVFCQQQGFAKAGKLDTQTEKVKAETLDGRACDKKKCRVFDLIVCTG